MRSEPLPHLPAMTSATIASSLFLAGAGAGLAGLGLAVTVPGLPAEAMRAHAERSR